MKRSFHLFIAVLALLVCSSLGFSAEGDMYRIKPGDQLNIYIHENPDLTMTVSVLPDGTISFPLVGSLFVQDLTTSGLENILTQKLEQFLQKPVVVITISSETLYKIYVMGEVKMSNAYPFQENKRLTDYLAMAGGPTEEANLKKCNVYPADPSKPRLIVNLNEIFDDKNRSKDVILQANDTVLLERRSGFIISDWIEISQVFSIILGVATIYLITERR